MMRICLYILWSSVEGSGGGDSYSPYQYPGRFGDSQGMNPKAQQKADNRQKTNITTYGQINQNIIISVPINNCIKVLNYQSVPCQSITSPMYNCTAVSVNHSILPSLNTYKSVSLFEQIT